MEYTKEDLFQDGLKLVLDILDLNRIPVPFIGKRTLNSAGLYNRGKCYVDVESCAKINPKFSYPNFSTNKTPQGVICHEIGHYLTDACRIKVAELKKIKEPPITGYAPNIYEKLAEFLRVFITNPELLREARPKSYGFICKYIKPLDRGSALECLGEYGEVPDEVLKRYEYVVSHLDETVYSRPKKGAKPPNLTSKSKPRRKSYDNSSGEVFKANQEWFDNAWIRNHSCGIATTAELLAPILHMPEDKEAYLWLMNLIYPKYINLGAGGSRPPEHVEGLNKFFKDHGDPYKAAGFWISSNERKDPRRKNMEEYQNCVNFIKEHIDGGFKVCFLNLGNADIPNLISWHWVTIDSYREINGTDIVCSAHCSYNDKIQIDFLKWYMKGIKRGGLVSIESVSEGGVVNG